LDDVNETFYILDVDESNKEDIDSNTELFVQDNLFDKSLNYDKFSVK